MGFLNKITDEDVKLLPKIGYDGVVHIIDNYKDQNMAADYLSRYRVIGFDTESRAVFKKGVNNVMSLVQLFAGEKAFLIRVNKIRLTQSIVDILQSEKHIKVGVALNDDISYLQKINQFTPKGFFDLQKVVKDFNIEELSLKKISAIVVGIQISKAQRLSNWNVSTLTEKQIRYAATDAWVCHEIYNRLEITPELAKKGEITASAKSKNKKYKKVKKVESTTIEDKTIN